MFVLLWCIAACVIAILAIWRPWARDPHKKALRELARQEHARARMEDWYN